MPPVFGLPPGINNGAAASTDLLVIPHPRFRIDRFADRAEQAQRAEIVFLDVMIARLDERTDRSGSGVKDSHLVVSHDLPEAIPIRLVRRAFIHDLSGSISHRTIDNVAVAGNPAHIRRTPVDIVRLVIEDVLKGRRSPGHVTAGSVENPLGFSRWTQRCRE